MTPNNENNNAGKSGTLDRRTALRRMAAATAGIALCRGASADIPVPKLSFNNGERCKRAITLLLPRKGDGKGMSFGQLLYQPFLSNLDWMIDNSKWYKDNGGDYQYPAVAACQEPLEKLQSGLQALVNEGDPRGNWPLAQFYYQDFPSGYPNSLRGPFRSFGAVAASPFLTLPDRTSQNPHRGDVEGYLKSDAIRLLLSDVEVYLLFCRDRDRHLSADADPAKYLLARGSFDNGIFHEKGRSIPGVSGDPEDNRVTPNNKCWSENDHNCMDQTDAYCEKDDNDEPSTASDVCT